MSFTCTVCGEKHSDIPHIGFESSYYWGDTYFKDSKSLLTKDLCIIEEEHFFVRGVIEIPVHGSDIEFGWGVWVSHKEENFRIYQKRFEDAEIGPFFGWLSSEISYYPEPTLELKTMAYYRGGGIRPRIVLEPTEHPLSRHQREGISLSEVWKIVHQYETKL